MLKQRVASQPLHSQRSTRSQKIRLRPPSAKEIFESNNLKRNEEAWKQEQMEAIASQMKKREWQAKFYTSLSRYEPNMTESDWKEKERREKVLSERRDKLIALFAKDNLDYEEEREKRKKVNIKAQGLPPNLSHPEIELLKMRLDDLKRQNAEERKKIAEKLSYEVWRKNDAGVRQMESDRFNQFVREAWVDQKQAKEDEKRLLEGERRKSEIAAAERRMREEEEEKIREDVKEAERLRWKAELDNQIMEIKKREEDEMNLRKKEKTLECERLRLQELMYKREKIKEERKRRDLELFWARQYQLKLKKKASNVQTELLEDELIVEDLLRRNHNLQEEVDLSNEEGSWMLSILEEQKNLERLREREYDLLFSEEAERMWLKREADWKKEEAARDKLIDDVMIGLQNQISEKLASTQQEIESKKNERNDLIFNIENRQREINAADDVDDCEGVDQESKPVGRAIDTSRQIRREELLRDNQIKEHQKEIARLEDEMRKLWQSSYVPPKFGRKRADW